VAPNIYYLGAANVVRFGGLRIAGLSGIWKGYNYSKPHFERLPYDEDEIKSLYHVREIDVRKLVLLQTQVDIGISHDWPRGIEWQGDYKNLFRKKDLFEADARAGTLGSSAAKYVMDRLRPPNWFSAHLHCKYAAAVEYDPAGEQESRETPTANDEGHTETNVARNADEIDVDLDLDGDQPQQAPSSKPLASIKNEDEINLDINDDDEPSSAPQAPLPTAIMDPLPQQPSESAPIPSDIRSQLPAAFFRPKPSQEKPQALPPPPGITNNRTRFLALDKCLPNRKFLQILSINPHNPSIPPAPLCLTYDKEWLAILRVFASHDPHETNPLNLGEAAYAPLIAKEEKWVEENIVKRNDLGIPGTLAIPSFFEITAPVYDGKAIGSVGREQPREYSNPQTKYFCEMLGIPYWFGDTEEVREERRRVKGVLIEGSRGRGGGRGGGRGRGRGHGGGVGGGRGGGRGSNGIPLGARGRC